MDIIVLPSMAKACLCSPFFTTIFPLSKTSIVMWTITASQYSQQCDQSLEAKLKRKHTSLAGSSSCHSTRNGSGHGTFLSFKEVYYYSKTCKAQFQSCCFVKWVGGGLTVMRRVLVLSSKTEKQHAAGHKQTHDTMKEDRDNFCERTKSMN